MILGRDVHIGPGSFIYVGAGAPLRLGDGTYCADGEILSVHRGELSIGRVCAIAAGTRFLSFNGYHISPGGPHRLDLHLGDRVWVGVGAILLAGTSIGSDCVVAANTFGDNGLVGGVPARVLREGITWGDANFKN